MGVDRETAERRLASAGGHVSQALSMDKYG